MDIPVDEFIEGLLYSSSQQRPCDTELPNPEDTKLPPWFDEKKFNQGRRFFLKNSFAFSLGAFYGLVSLLSLPSILKVLMGSHRSSSVYTAYKRYSATFIYATSWLSEELKPGSRSWLSLTSARKTHFRASNNKKVGVVSQRDMSISLFSFTGYAILYPDKLGIVSMEPGDWEGYVEVFRTVGYMVGLEDRFNICRKNIEETREVFRVILERVYRPALENPPEYFEHMSRVLLDGLWNVNLLSDTSVLFLIKYMAEVPGYILTEGQRVEFLTKLRKINKERGMPLDTPVESSLLLSEPAIEGLATSSQVYCPRDYDSWATIPTFGSLSWYEKFKVNIVSGLCFIAATKYGRMLLNLYYSWIMWCMEHFPYYAFFKFGIKRSYIELFRQSPVDKVIPMKNEEFFKKKALLPSYRKMFYGLIDSGL